MWHTYPEDLPWPDDAIVQGVNHTKHIPFAETHLSFIWLVVVKVSSENKKQKTLFFCRLRKALIETGNEQAFF